LSPDVITDDEINFRAIKTGLHRSRGIVEAESFNTLRYLLFGTLPEFPVSAKFIRAIVSKRQTDIHRHIKYSKHKLGQVNNIFNLVPELSVRAINVSVILCEPPYTRKPVQLPRLFISVHTAKLGQTNGQVAIA